jgi:adenylate kinase family enzyme
LRLHYKDQPVHTPNLRDKIEKEKELREQLQEARANETEVDPKGKGKKTSAKSPDEIEHEIKLLLSPHINGWILIDFPRNINQAKILENFFTGFTLNTDEKKPDEIVNFETWTKLTDPYSLTSEGYESKVEAQNSLFDIFFILDTPSEECIRRGRNRKIDNTSGAIYHIEDNPPPEDPKVAEKLANYFGNFESEADMVQKLKSNHI